MNRILPRRLFPSASASAILPFVLLALIVLTTAQPLRAQKVGPLPKPDPATEALFARVFKGVDKFFSVKEVWVQPVAQEIKGEDLRQLIFSMDEKEKKALANNIMKAGIAGFRPKNNRPGKTATITIYQLADTTKAPLMLKGLTNILNANRKQVDANPDFKIINFQGSEPKDETFPLLSYHTYALTQNSDANKSIEKFQVLRASTGDLFIDILAMNGDIPKEKLLAAAKALLINWNASRTDLSPLFKLKEKSKDKAEKPKKGAKTE